MSFKFLFKIISTCLPIFMCLGLYGIGVYLEFNHDYSEEIRPIAVEPHNADRFGTENESFSVDREVYYNVQVTDNNKLLFISDIYGPFNLSIYRDGELIHSELFSSYSTFGGRFIKLNQFGDSLVVGMNYYSLINFSREPKLFLVNWMQVDKIQFSRIFSTFILPLLACMFLYFVAAFFLRVSFFDMDLISYRYASLGAFGFSSVYFVTLFPLFAVEHYFLWQGLIYFSISIAIFGFWRFVFIYSEIDLKSFFAGFVGVLVFSWIPIYLYNGYSSTAFIDQVWIVFGIALLFCSVFIVIYLRGIRVIYVSLGLLLCLCGVIFDWLSIFLISTFDLHHVRMFIGPLGLLILFYIVFFDFFYKLNTAYKKKRESHKLMMIALREQRDELHEMYLLRSEDERLKQAWEEREVLARDLHDVVGSRLSTAILLLLRGNTSRLLVVNELKTCLMDMRTLILGTSVKNSEFIFSKFKSDYEVVLNSLNINFNVMVVNTALEMIGDVVLSEILKILRETITNGLKYKSPSSIELSIFQDDNFVFFDLNFLVCVVKSDILNQFLEMSGGMGDDLIRLRLSMVNGTLHSFESSDRLHFRISVPIAK